MAPEYLRALDKAWALAKESNQPIYVWTLDGRAFFGKVRPSDVGVSQLVRVFPAGNWLAVGSVTGGRHGEDENN